MALLLAGTDTKGKQQSERLGGQLAGRFYDMDSNQVKPPLC